ncbi:hypothetical protein Ctob_016640 [Chrysochromulina tobinii]|uniref:Uncharacterized protein n=1 Tax=Chrysochromulina tobinii TaxID=1460289 RepID=A0A0M0K8I4_9EUKA|nr:hypothetical protein Ctob_016640 [Chrysochromulina tobinii]|eukprot:KOO34703.1 hypothetical protein Ctob_016640 [Chrysochromulina sp. CCMP291]
MSAHDGARLEQDESATLVSKSARPHERSATVAIGERRIRPSSEEQLHDRLGALLRGEVERGAAPGALRIER